ncbi:recombinase [Clostridioides difficile]|uniref:recombinase family protein n=2 Tax=Clostridia TaxID=186801 RepID=UPI000E4FCCD5|nr:recombinase family protein [Clostridioides difficile]AXU75633.1 recombinase [Clostridioides difficile]MDI3115403.1 recombinase family protein [Clostridioides difficile]MDK3180671.1 recombinase family protein [Clostridioides difficile]HBF0842411.1 recombinase family protein [Clostridioides difficile]
MARTKNRETNRTVSQLSYNLTRWNLAKYIRLSKEDLNRGKDDSNSVTNQKKLLDDYYRQHLDEFESAETYVDDGCTGTDTNRADFQRLLADIYAKKVNCVIVKDLSRLSRNYTDAGSLIENLFVQMNVRFISLAEGVDSYLNPDSVSSILVPITNVMNDQYCYQTSKKIRQVFDYKKRNGEFIGSYAPYGYIKDPNDKHALLVDHEAAEVVKQIFSMCLSGMTVRAIVNHLNDHGVMCPSVYKQSQGLKYKCPNGQTQPMWSTITISNMLKNPVYVGDMAQGRNRVKSYKIHKIEAVPEKDWIVVQNTHEPIIDREAFEKVKQLLKRDTRTSPKQKQLYLFSGFLRCADCGRAMSRIASKEFYVYYQCGTYKSLSKKACTMHSIKSTRLEAAVLYAIRQQVHLAVSYSAIVSKINLAPLKKSQSARLNELIAAKEKELAKIMRYKQALYQDWKDGHITHNDYRHMNEDYEQQNEAIGTVIANLKKERDELENGIDTENPFLATFRKYENIDKLTREILIELVDHIKVYEGGDISIRFKFADELRRIIQYIEVNSHLQVG